MAEIIAAGVAVASDWLANLVISDHSVACSIINGTAYEMKSIDGIHTHHGQYKTAPTDLGKIPSSVNESETLNENIVNVEIDGAGAGAAEAIFGWDFKHKGKNLRFCVYAKHGHHVESGAALWEKGKMVNGEDYDSKIHNSAESFIHTIQKSRPNTIYSKDGENKHLTAYDLKVSISSGKTFIVTIQ